jgi:hypothetical protein
VNISLVPFIVLWIALALVVLGMVAWRKVVTRQEDETLHVMDTGAVSHQVEVSNKLDVIDKWGKLLTIVAVVYGLILAAVYLYRSWIEMSRIGL